MKKMNLEMLTSKINLKYDTFANLIRPRLTDLHHISESDLEWIILEDFQFSSTNLHFLSLSAEMTDQLLEKGISSELRENLSEENTHAKIYQIALAEIGTDIAKHQEFIPSTQLFKNLENLIKLSPSHALGAIYAMEGSALFGSEVFNAISRELVTRRGIDYEKTKLKAFHKLHLSGVEQAHRDDLGAFIDAAEKQDTSTIKIADVWKGASGAIDAIIKYADSMFTKIKL
jgi:heme oxygenase